MFSADGQLPRRLDLRTYFGTLGRAVFMNKKKSVSDWDSSISVDAASVPPPPPSVARNTVSCGECVGELMA